MRVLVTGSRDWSDGKTLQDALTYTYLDWKKSDPPAEEDFVVVHGAARGADTLAGAWVESIGKVDTHIKVETHPANWEKYGNVAGHKRNQEMLDTGIDLVLAFQVGKSPGTKGCVKMAKRMDIVVKEFCPPKLW
jgi:YspA, cpYpsA-related SLOG family